MLRGDRLSHLLPTKHMTAMEIDSQSVPALYLELCRAHLAHGKKDEAAMSLEKGLKIFPDDVQLLTEYGRLLGKERRVSEILPKLENAVLDLSKPREVFKLLASIYKSIGEREGAIAAYRVFLDCEKLETFLRDRFMGLHGDLPVSEPPARKPFPEASALKRKREEKKRAITKLSLLQARMARGLHH